MGTAIRYWGMVILRWGTMVRQLDRFVFKWGMTIRQGGIVVTPSLQKCNMVWNIKGPKKRKFLIADQKGY